METINVLIQNQAVLAGVLVSLLSSVATVVLIFVPTSKVNKYVAPVVAILNKLAGNVGNNK